MKKFISGVVLASLVFGATNVFGVSGKMIEVFHSVNSLVVNGVDTGAGNKAFISNGTTYVPLRTIADALGVNATWDASTKTININGSVNTSSGSNSLPADLNTTPVQAPTSTPVVPVQPAVPSINYISEQQARNLALKAVGGGTVIYAKSDLYDKHPDYEYKIIFNNRIYEVEVDAITGIVTDLEIDD